MVLRTKGSGDRACRGFPQGPDAEVWLERILEANPAGADHLVGSSVTYADLSLFQLIEGLQFAFSLASERELAKLPRVTDLHWAVAERPRLKVYLASDRRVAFKETGIFRRYSELDG